MLAVIPLNGLVGRTFIPNEDMGEFVVHIDGPEGTSLEGMSEIAQDMSTRLRHIEGIAQLQPTIWAGQSLTPPGPSSNPSTSVT